MKEIFSKKYAIWWFILCLVIGLKIKILGFKVGGLNEMPDYENRGIIFWIIGTLFTSFIFSLPFYFAYRLFRKTSDYKVLMILISVMSGILLVFLI
ncbi:MAG: hypothetical protein ACOH1N_09840 [Lutibacter sp.]